MTRVGFKSSEFWVVLVSGFISAIGAGLGLSEHTIALLISLATAYLASRTLVKVVEIKKNNPGQSISPLILVSLALFGALIAAGFYVTQCSAGSMIVLH